MWKTIDLAPKDGTVILTEQGSVCYVAGWYLCAFGSKPNLNNIFYENELSPKYWYDGITDAMSVKDIEEHCEKNLFATAIKGMIALFDNYGAVFQWHDARTSPDADKAWAKICGALVRAKDCISKS